MSNSLKKLDLIVTRNGILIDVEKLKQAIGDKNYEYLKKYLTITKTKTIGKKHYIKQMLLYKLISAPDGKIFFTASRFSMIKSEILECLVQRKNKIPVNYINNLPSGESIADKFRRINSSMIDLEDYQQLCFDHIMENYFNPQKVAIGAASCILVMDTGLGKTFTASAFIEQLKLKTLVIIPNKSNLDGWYDPFKIYLKNLKVGEYHSNKKEDGDVVIMTIDSALSDVFTLCKYNEETKKKQTEKLKYFEYFKKFGFVIYDEIHNYPTATQQEIFWRTNFQYGLGLTATPNERIDGMDIVYYRHVGPVVQASEISGFNDLVRDLKWKGNVEIIEYHGPPEYTEVFKNALGWNDISKIQQQISKDPYRSQLILNKIKEKYQMGRNIFIFAIYREFLLELYKFLVENEMTVSAPELNENSEVMTFMGGATMEDKKKAKEKARIILMTYSFGKESISIVKMDSIILAQSVRNKMRQILGRILRRGGDASIERDITDIVDKNTPLRSQLSTRLKIYREKGFDIKYTEVNYDNYHLHALKQLSSDPFKE